MLEPLMFGRCHIRVAQNFRALWGVLGIQGGFRGRLLMFNRYVCGLPQGLSPHLKTLWSLTQILSNLYVDSVKNTNPVEVPCAQDRSPRLTRNESLPRSRIDPIEPDKTAF